MTPVSIHASVDPLDRRRRAEFKLQQGHRRVRLKHWRETSPGFPKSIMNSPLRISAPPRESTPDIGEVSYKFAH